MVGFERFEIVVQLVEEVFVLCWHLWVVSLNHIAHLIPQICLYLSPQERQQASRFYAEADRQRALVSRGVLRLLLGGYTGVRPESICLGAGKNGKPLLHLPKEDSGLFFNASHSDDVLLFAFSRSFHVGVDVERVRPMDDVHSLAGQFFHPLERVWFCSMPRHERLAAFFALWTRKEAYVKATGEGLSCALDSFSVIGEGARGRCFGLFHSGQAGGPQGVGISWVAAPGYPASVVAL